MTEQLFLKPDEGKFLALAVTTMLTDITEVATDQTINWNPSVRKNLKEMIAAGTSLRIKLQKLGFNMDKLQPYQKGDENDFLTKQS